MLLFQGQDFQHLYLSFGSEMHKKSAFIFFNAPIPRRMDKGKDLKQQPSAHPVRPSKLRQTGKSSFCSVKLSS